MPVRLRPPTGLLPSWLPPLWEGGSRTISPTAHYTGYVWARHGLGDPSLATPEGRAFYLAGQVAMVPLDLLGAPTLEHFLLARHRVIDLLLTREIEAGRVRQVVELACGMSPRGHSLVTTYGDDLTYVEVDLPGMAARKRAALARLGTLGPHHRVEAADVMTDAGLGPVFDRLDPQVGVAVVTEGLLNYFPTPTVEGLWSRVAAQLARFPHGTYLSDLHVHATASLPDRLFAAGLGLAVRGRVHFHFADDRAAEEALLAAGFAEARLHAPAEYAAELPGTDAAGAGRVRVVEARRDAPTG